MYFITMHLEACLYSCIQFIYFILPSIPYLTPATPHRCPHTHGGPAAGASNRACCCTAAFYSRLRWHTHTGFPAVLILEYRMGRTEIGESGGWWSFIVEFMYLFYCTCRSRFSIFFLEPSPELISTYFLPVFFPCIWTISFSLALLMHCIYDCSSGIRRSLSVSSSSGP